MEVNAFHDDKEQKSKGGIKSDWTRCNAGLYNAFGIRVYRYIVLVVVMVESPAFGKEGLEDLSRLDR